MKAIIKLLVVITFLFSFTTTNKLPPDLIRVVKTKQATFIYLFQNLNFDLNEIKIEKANKKQMFIIVKYLKVINDYKVKVNIYGL